MKNLCIIFSFVLLPFLSLSQTTNTPGVCLDKTCATPNDKAGSFTNTYTNTQCGLNYAIGGVKITQRATWQPGVGQPATINISSMPICVNPSQGDILRAYVYWIVEGGPVTGNVTLTNPASGTASFPGTLIGNISGGKCWSWGNTRHFRADVTSHITGNGNYVISGLPASTNSTTGDTDGAALIIIYRDPAATYQGTMVLHDGNILVTGGAQNHTLTGFSACAAGTNASAFSVIGDLQNNVTTTSAVTMNGVTANVPNNFFNLEIRNVTVTAGQSNSLFGVSTSGDCWSWICSGLYFQTNSCVTCTPTGGSGNPSWTNPSPICAANGSINLNSLVTGTAGGTWSGTGVSGSTFNPASGSQSVTYTVGTAPCTQSQTHTITVRPDVNPAWTNPSPICAAAGSINLNSLITGTTGGSWSGTGVSGSTFNPSSGSQSVTYTVGTSPCQETQTHTITVRPDVNPAWTNPGPLCAANGGTVTLVPAQAGGTWSGTGVTSGGVFSLSAGTQSITYTIGTAPCQESSTQTITVRPDVNPAWTNPSPICAAAGSINLNSLITGTTGGSWSGTGVSGSTFNPSSGSQSVTYTVGTSPCQETQTHTITVVPDVNPAWTNPSPICAAAGSINLNSLITGTTGGSWSGTGVSGSTFNPSSGSQSVTYTVGTAPCVETQTHTITVVPDVNPAWTNPSPICAASGPINLNNLITGTTGGTWSGTGVSGNSFDPSFGSQSVTYTVGTAPCVETQTHTITVATVSAAWTNPSPICEGDAPINLSALVTGSAGGSFSGTGVSANTLDPSGLGGSSVTITYTVGAAPCTETLAHTIVINNDDDASFSYPQSSYCVTGNNPTPTVTGTPGGTFTISAPGSINATTGEINLAASGTGSFTVIYNTAAAGNPCPVSDTLTITITTGQSAGFSYDNAQYCVYDNTPILTINGGATAGNFSATPSGLTIDNAGNITLPSSTPGVYTVYNNVPAANGCAPAIDSTTIEILPLDTATFNYAANAYCLADANPLPTVTGTPGGTFTISPASGVINPTTGEIDINASGAGSYTIYYNTSAAGNPCPVTDSVTVTLLPQNFIAPDTIANFCLGDSTALTAAASGNGTITWYSDAAGTNIIGTGSPFFPPVTAAGTYTYYVNETGTCPSPMDSVTFTVQHVDAQASANPTDGPVPLVVNFSNNSTGATNYFWDFANGNLDSTFAPTQTYTEPGTYTVTLVVTDGLCWDSTTVIIEVFNESSLTIPNVFTPNGDGHNDFFTVDGENLKSVEGEIYNRWGQKMFAWGNVNGYWDGKTLAGKDAPDGTYFFIIKAEGIDGKQYFQKGTVSLIR